MAFNREKTLANAQKQLRKGNVERAIKEYERVLEEDSDDVRSKLKLADLYVKVDRFDDALHAYGEVAFSYAKDDLYEKAAAVYKQALRVSPEDPALHEQLGEAYYRLGRLKDAVRVFHKAQKIYKRLDDVASQRGVLERMTEVDPDDVGLKIQLAERYEKDGLRQEALDLFGAAANALKEEGRLDEYVQVAERIIYLQPDLFDMRKEVVRIYLGRGDEKHALKHLQYCFKVNPQDIETLELLASTFHRLGSTQKSLLVYGELAALYERSGEMDRAASVYRTILSIDHTHEYARQFLGQEAGRAHNPAPSATPQASEEADEDALAGIEFLDESEAILEVDESDIVANGDNGFMDFAEDTIRELDDANLEHMQAYPEAPLGDDNTAAAVEIEEGMVEEVDDAAGTGNKQIKQFLTESEVFLKYGLLDRAEEVITKVLQLEPNNLGGRDQMRKLLERMGDKRGAAHQLVEMARITQSDPDRSSAYLRQASALVDEGTLRTLASGAGLDFEDVALDMAPEFIDEVSEGLEEISSVTGMDDEDVGADDLEDIFLIEDEDEADETGLSGLSAVSETEEVPELDAEHPDETIEDLHLDDVTSVDVDADMVELDEMEVGEMDVEEMELGGADLVDVEIDDVDFDEQALGLLEDVSDGAEVEITEIDAGSMFDELFGAAAFDGDEVVELGGEATDTSGDFEFEEDASGHDFGARSLSKKFNPVDTSSVRIDVDSVNNSSLELGRTYQDMGLFEEAIEEFRHALDDPDAAAAALYSIAVCNIELGETESAHDQLKQLSNDEAAPNGWREKASEKLQEISV